MLRLVTSSHPQLGHLEEGSSFPSPSRTLCAPRSVLKMWDPYPDPSLGSSATFTCYPPQAISLQGSLQLQHQTEKPGSSLPCSHGRGGGGRPP